MFTGVVLDGVVGDQTGDGGCVEVREGGGAVGGCVLERVLGQVGDAGGCGLGELVGVGFHGVAVGRLSGL